MIFEKFIDKDLGQVSYVLGCQNSKEAFIVDPRRDINEYEKFLEANGLTLKYVFNTHTHADYVGGHVELASKYDIDNIFHYKAPITNYDIVKVKENDTFYMGENISVKVLETPGHTPFDICLLIIQNGVAKYLFSGDFLFSGDVGRPDLLGEPNLQMLANSSYESAKKLWNLDDGVMIFTSHIEGSLCGKSLNPQFFSTIGIEKQINHNFALSQRTKQEYVKSITSLNIETPAFFKKMAGINIEGPKLLKDIFAGIKEVSFQEIKDNENLQIIDLRNPQEFYKSHIKGSINIYENSNVSLIAGSLLNYEKDIYLVGGNDLDDFIVKLLRVGLDKIKGVLVQSIDQIESNYLTPSKMVLKENVDKSYVNIVLDKGCSSLGEVIQSNMSKIQQLDISMDKNFIFSCKYGYKSSAIASLLNEENIYTVAC